jgi:hypothetical protein
LAGIGAVHDNCRILPHDDIACVIIEAQAMNVVAHARDSLPE